MYFISFSSFPDYSGQVLSALWTFLSLCLKSNNVLQGFHLVRHYHLLKKIWIFVFERWVSCVMNSYVTGARALNCDCNFMHGSFSAINFQTYLRKTQSQQNIHYTLALFEETNPRLEEDITKHGSSSVINSFRLNWFLLRHVLKRTYSILIMFSMTHWLSFIIGKTIRFAQLSDPFI